MPEKKPSLFPYNLTPGGPELSISLLQHIPEELRGNADASLLLVGCRLGENLLALAEHFPGKLIGIDEDAETIYYAKWAVKEAGMQEQVSARMIAPVQTNFQPGHFDIVILEGMFAGYPPTRVLKEALRVLSPDGWLLLSDSCWLDDDVPTYVREVWEGPDHKLLTPAEVRTLLEERGLEVLALENWSDALGPFYEQFRGTVKDMAKGGFEGLKHLKGLVKHYKHEIDVYSKHRGYEYMGYLGAVARPRHADALPRHADA